MSGRKGLIRNIICVLLGLVLAGVLIFIYYRDNRADAARAAEIESLQAEALPYENELQELRSELTDLKNGVSYSRDEAGIAVGFVLSDASDLSWIRDRADTYGFAPVVILDCEMDRTELEGCIDALAENETYDGWEIMLYSSAFSEDTNDDVLAAVAYLESVGKTHSGVFFLRDDYAGTANKQLLADDGFVGYTLYHDSPAAGQTEDGLIYFDYSYLAAEGSSVTSRLSSLYGSKSAMIVVFDMAAVNSGALSETYVTALLDTLLEYAEKDDCAFTTVAALTEELSGVNAVEEENQAALEEQAAAIEARIEELEEIIDGIYDRLE